LGTLGPALGDALGAGQHYWRRTQAAAGAGTGLGEVTHWVLLNELGSSVGVSSDCYSEKRSGSHWEMHSGAWSCWSSTGAYWEATGTELRAYWEALGVGDALNNTVSIRWALHQGEQCCTGVLRPALGPFTGTSWETHSGRWAQHRLHWDQLDLTQQHLGQVTGQVLPRGSLARNDTGSCTGTRHWWQQLLHSEIAWELGTGRELGHSLGLN
jgi:hypothetical protein